MERVIEMLLNVYKRVGLSGGIECWPVKKINAEVDVRWRNDK